MCVVVAVSHASIPPCSLGKTLQSIALLWTLLRQGFSGASGPPLVQRALIVTPTSLVSNWNNELNKWLAGRVKAAALCEASRAEALAAIKQFLMPRNHADVRLGRKSASSYPSWLDRKQSASIKSVHIAACSLMSENDVLRIYLITRAPDSSSKLEI